MNPFENTVAGIRAEIAACLPCQAAPIRFALMAIFSGSAEPIRAAVVAAMSAHEAVFPLGAALELMDMSIHQLHEGLDDIHKPRYTLGVAGDVLSGDYLSSGAFRLLVKCNDVKVMKVVADAVQESCELEVLLINRKISDSRDAFAELSAAIKQRATPLGKAAGLAGAVVAGYNDQLLLVAESYGQHMASAHALLKQGRSQTSADFLDLAGVELNEAIFAAEKIERKTSNDKPLSLCEVLKAEIDSTRSLSQ